MTGDVMGSHFKIAAVIVTYNRKALLLECIDALLAQTRPPEAIFIIDNASTDGTGRLLHENGLIGRTGDEAGARFKGGMATMVRYVRLPENAGGSGGFYEGVKLGYEAGYDWLWLMDDDAEPQYDALKILEEFLQENRQQDIAVLASKVVDKKGNVQACHRLLKTSRGGWSGCRHLRPNLIPDETYEEKSVEIGYASFVGFLANRKAIEKQGLPNKDYFILFDDTEYSVRLSKSGKIILVNGSIIVHKDDQKAKQELSGLWRRYYGLRNQAFLARDHFNAGPVAIFFAIFLKAFIRIFRISKFKRKESAIVIKAYMDFLKNRSGKILDPKSYRGEN